MATLVDLQNALKYRVTLALLALAGGGAVLGTLFHYLEPQTNPINLVAPPLLAITCFSLLIYLYKYPQNLKKITYWGLMGGILFVLLPNWLFILAAAFLDDITLIDTFPPIVSMLFLVMMLLMTYLRPRDLLKAVLGTWILTAAPLLLYLIFHPQELMTPRGLDFFMTLGPTMAVQLVLIFFFNQLQDLVDRLYQERLQYYEKVIERQTIRQQAMEHTFNQIHNGPLQTLALLMRDLQQHAPESADLLQRLQELNAEIRAVGQSLAPTIGEHILRLAEGTCIDLNHPLHNLCHEVYAQTLKRDLPHFQGIRVKVRNFAPLEPSTLSIDLKRDICLWLEEALCNVGKHAQGTTRILVTGQPNATEYVLKVQDNGHGFQSTITQQGTEFSQLLAHRLGGTFERRMLPQGGVCAELSWPLPS
jgi:two-component sensor histidine kinase